MLCVLFLFPLCGWAVPQETFLPPQRIPIDNTVLKIVAIDVNGDAFDDIVALTTDGIDVYLNEGKPRGPTEAVTFFKTPLPLTTHLNTEAIEDRVDFGTGGGDLQVTDLDGDNRPDLLVTNAATGEIFVLWNLTTNGSFPFVFMPDTSSPTDPSMTILSPLATRTFGGAGVLGTPIYVAAANLGDGSGRKSIVIYSGGLHTQEPNPTNPNPPKFPFNQLNYESFGILYPSKGTKRGFDLATQRLTWPNCDLAFGGASPGCVGWNDGMPANTSLYNFRVSTGVPSTGPGLNFDDAGSDIITMDGWTPIDYGGQMYKAGVVRPNASPGLQIIDGTGPNGSASIWLDGNLQMNEFVHDGALKLLRRRNAIPTVEGQERSSGSTFATLSDGQTALITAGGMDVYYDPTNVGSVVKHVVPDYLNRDKQVGSWMSWARFNKGSALMSLSDYCRTPDPCVAETGWYHAPLDGSAAPTKQWGGSRSLLMLDYAKEMTIAGGTQFMPFFDNLDDGRFQAISIMGGSIDHKPLIAAGNFGAPGERALMILDHQDGNDGDPMLTYLALYRPDTAGKYVAPIPAVQGLLLGKYVRNNHYEPADSIPQGENSTVLVGDRLGSADAVRVAIVRDLSGTVKGLFAVNKPEFIPAISKDAVVVPGLSTLPQGSYTIEVRNSNQTSAPMSFSVKPALKSMTTDYDWNADNTCGILPTSDDPITKAARVYPAAFRIDIDGDFAADQLQKIRLVSDSGSVKEILAAPGAAWYDTAAKAIGFVTPTDLPAGNYRIWVKAGFWQLVPHTWTMTRDAGTLTTCQQQSVAVNHLAYAQCDEDTLYLDTAQFQNGAWPGQAAAGNIIFYGRGFANIKTATMCQGTNCLWPIAITPTSDNELSVYWGDLKSQFTEGQAVDIRFYTETQDIVQAQDVPVWGVMAGWRTAKSGTCPQVLPSSSFSIVNSGSGAGGRFQSGDWIEVEGDHLWRPVPTAKRLLLHTTTGAIYALGEPRLPDTLYTEKHDNTKARLFFPVPADLTSNEVIPPGSSATTGSGGTTEQVQLMVAEEVVADTALLPTFLQSDSAILAGLLSTGSDAASVFALAKVLDTGSKAIDWASDKIGDLIVSSGSPTGTYTPGMPGGNQSKDEPHVIFFTYELAQPDLTRSKFIYASTLLASAYDALYNQSALVKQRVAEIEHLSTLQISEYADDYWDYSNALVIRRTDLGPKSRAPKTIHVQHYTCTSVGWNMAPLNNVSAETDLPAILTWKMNIFFGWNPREALSDSDFNCQRISRDVSIDITGKFVDSY